MPAMPAREAESRETETEAETEALVEEPAAEQATISSEGDLPAVAQGAGAVGVTASTLAFDGETKQAPSDTSHLDKGIHHWEAYKAACDAAGKSDKWKDHYRAGHTEAKGWTQPYEQRRVYEWELKKGTSASQAVQDFLAGPTIADYRVASVADELDELRDELGDPKFDLLFGSANKNEDERIPKAQRLRISAAAYGVPLIDQMKAIAREHDALAKPGDEPAAPVVESRVEEKPKAAPLQDQEPDVIAQELGMQQQDRELV